MTAIQKKIIPFTIYQSNFQKNADHLNGISCLGQARSNQNRASLIFRQYLLQNENFVSYKKITCNIDH